MDQPKQEQARRVSDSAFIGGAIVAAALILSWGMSGGGPKYQLAGSAGGVVRMDTDSAEMISCDKQGCAEIQEPDRAKMADALGLKEAATVKDTQRKLDPAKYNNAGIRCGHAASWPTQRRRTSRSCGRSSNA
jgi:hypothetical protein